MIFEFFDAISIHYLCRNAYLRRELAHITNHIKAKVELNARKQYYQQFSIKNVWGHSMMNDNLRAMIMNDYDELSAEEEKCLRISAMEKVMKFKRVCSYTLERTKLTLEITSGINYSATVDADDDVWRDKIEVKGVNVKPCDKLLINQKLFDNYFNFFILYVHCKCSKLNQINVLTITIRYLQ